MIRSTRSKLLMLGLVLALAGCETQTRFHGYAPDEGDLAEIKVGRDTRDSVAELVGRPSAGGLMEDGGWYYVRSRWETRGASAPVEVDRQVVAISFDKRGTVSNVERFGLAEGQVVPLSRRVTQTNVRGMSFVRRLLAAAGRVDPTRLLNRSN
jgi:outer membrane protein assembly factor BamE (lipoprotein component of BamABCDE complex)